MNPVLGEAHISLTKASAQPQINLDAHVQYFFFIREYQSVSTRVFTFPRPIRTLPLSVGRQDVGVTLVENGHGGATEELSASGAELNLFPKQNKSAKRIPSKAEVSCFFSGMKIRLSDPLNCRTQVRQLEGSSRRAGSSRTSRGEKRKRDRVRTLFPAK
jgi:hypothetical protein